MTSSYLIFAGGAVIGAVGSLVFISRSLSTSDRDGIRDAAQDRTRLLALLATLGIYTLLTFACFVIALALAEDGLAIIAGTLLLLAIAGLIGVWMSQGGSSKAADSAELRSDADSRG